MVNTVMHDPRVKLGTDLLHAQNASLVVFVGAPPVLMVDSSSGYAKVRNSVIPTLAVYVVDWRIWERSMHIEPRKPMSQVHAPVDHELRVPGCGMNPAGSLSSSNDTTPAHKIRQEASFVVVVKKFAQTLRGKIGISHDALQLLIGQRPARVDSASGLRYFSVT